MLRLKNDELITLLYHLSIMKKPFKKGIKKTHSKQEVKEYVVIYQSVIEKLEHDNLQEKEFYEVFLDNNEIELLRAFLSWYIAELEVGISEGQQQGLEILKTINHMLLVPT